MKEEFNLNCLVRHPLLLLYLCFILEIYGWRCRIILTVLWVAITLKKYDRVHAYISVLLQCILGSTYPGGTDSVGTRQEQTQRYITYTATNTQPAFGSVFIKGKTKFEESKNVPWLIQDRLFQIEFEFNYWNISAYCCQSEFIIVRSLCWEITRNNSVNYFELRPVFDKNCLHWLWGSRRLCFLYTHHSWCKFFPKFASTDNTTFCRDTFLEFFPLLKEKSWKCFQQSCYGSLRILLVRCFPYC